MKILETLKFSKWWRPKIGTGVFSWILFSIYLTHKIETDLKTLLLFGLLILLGVLGHLINDASDYKQDKKVGKNNLFNKFGIQRAPWIILTFIIAATFLSFQFNRLICYLTILQIFLNCFYSFPPIRLKEKGWWSVVITGFYERTIPYAIILFWLIIPQDLTVVQIIFLFFYFSWAYLWECRNYINGQSEDIKNDKTSGTNSLILTVGNTSINKIKGIILKTEILFLIGWLILLFFLNIKFPTYFLSCVTLLLFIHRIVDKKPYYTIRLSDFLDFTYCNLFISSLLFIGIYLKEIHLVIGLLLIVIFQSNYARGILITYFNWGITYSVRLYYFIFGIGSFVVNYTIYYLRKLFKRNVK